MMMDGGYEIIYDLDEDGNIINSSGGGKFGVARSVSPAYSPTRFDPEGFGNVGVSLQVRDSDSTTEDSEWEEGELEYGPYAVPTSHHNTDERKQGCPKRVVNCKGPCRSAHSQPEEALSTADHSVSIPRGEFARARRLLVPDDSELPLMTVDLRADCQFVSRSK